MERLSPLGAVYQAGTLSENFGSCAGHATLSLLTSDFAKTDAGRTAEEAYIQ